MSRGEHSKKHKINIPLLIFRIVSIIIILICIYKIYNWYKENKTSKEMLGEIQQIAGVTEVLEYKRGKAYKLLEVDFQSLDRKNADTVAWIKINDTNIDYPVVQAEDNFYYLTHSFDKSNNSAGWIFADYRNDFENLDQNTIIYGHNRKDGSMFGTLGRVGTNAWVTNEENRYISFSTPTENMNFEIFSEYTIQPEEYYLTTNFSNEESYMSFLNTLKKRSAYNFGVELTASDKILTLSTCSGTGMNRFVVHAKKIDLQEVETFETVESIVLE